MRSTIASNRGVLRVEQLPRGQALARRGLLDLLAVLVDPGQEEDVIAVEPHEARDRIGRNGLVGVADMRHPVGIGDRGGDVVARLFGHLRSMSIITGVRRGLPKWAKASPPQKLARPGQARPFGLSDRYQPGPAAARVGIERRCRTPRWQRASFSRQPEVQAKRASKDERPRNSGPTAIGLERCKSA